MSSIQLADRIPFEIPAIQKELIPKESYYVRLAMRHAAVWSMEQDPLICRAVPLAFVTMAVALSALNTLTYFLATPVKLILNIVQLDPQRLVSDLFLGPLNAFRSVVFVVLGVSFIGLGLVIPKAIFSCFDPEFVGTENDRLTSEVERLEEEKKALLGKIEELALKNQRQADEIHGLKTGRKSWLPWG